MHNCLNSNEESLLNGPNTPFRSSEPIPKEPKQVVQLKIWRKITEIIQLN